MSLFFELVFGAALIRCLPMGAQIGVSLVFTGGALLCIAGAGAAVGSLALGISDVIKSASGVLLGLFLLWISWRLWP